MLRASLALGVLVVSPLGAQRPAAAGYVDPASCAECHAGIAASYARTGMARSLHALRPEDALPEFDGAPFSHAASGERFTPARRGGRHTVRREGPMGTGMFEATVDYVLGSGDRARSYLHRTRDDRLTEFPVTWYAEEGGHWGMSPGYDRAGHQGFSREVSYRCMFCHNGYPEVDARAEEGSAGAVYPKRIPKGIDCQRCHGPGGSHVEAEGRGAIVNPARLAPERRLEICMQCHLESTSAPLPAAIMRFGRGAFSYRAGEPLADFLVFFDHAAGAGYDDKFEIVSAAYRFRKSACFVKSSGRFECTTCHDPHRAATRGETVAKAERACSECHAAASRHAVSRSCVGCHMARRNAEDVIHVAMTDHWIQKRPAPSKAVTSEEIKPPYAGEVALFYPPNLPPTPENTLMLAVAQIKDLANIPAGLSRLETLLEAMRPQHGRPYFDLAEALESAGQVSRAIPFYGQAALCDPQNRRYLLGLARASGQVVDFERARALGGGDTAVLLALGNAYAGAGRLAAAADILGRAIERNPENAVAHESLGEALLRAGDLAGAERALRESIRLAPEVVSSHIGLASVLIARRKPDAAGRALELALRAGPSIESAQTVWFRILSETGSVPRALAGYESSLRAQLAPAHVNLGVALMMQGDAAGALRQYQLAVSADPESGVALTNLALALMQRGEAVEARQRLEQAVRVSPALFEAHLHLGELLAVAGETEAAKAHLRRASQSPDQRIRAAAADAMIQIHN